ncbi:MAG: diaminopimelate decarboxylase, partial [bacterium]
EQKLALENDIYLFNVESMPELAQLNEVARSLGQKARISFRVNPDINAPTHEKITTGKKETKFGVPGEKLEQYARRADELDYIELRGLHFHIGSQITSPEPFLRLAKNAREYVQLLRQNNHRIEVLNLGGGLGISYRDEQSLTPADWAEAVLPEISDLDLKIIVEPGRFIVGNAGILISKVLYVKEVQARNFIVVDSGMNTLLRPAMYDAYHRIKPVVNRQREKIEADVVGPVCETGDILGKNRIVEKPKSGEHLAVYGAGAYGFSMASNYNSYPRPAEVVVSGNKETLIRERENYQDLWRHEKY